MRQAPSKTIAVFILAAACALPAARAEVAILRDGGKASGQLVLNRDGRLEFKSSTRTMPLDRIQLIRFRPAATALATFEHRIWLADNQHFSGTLLKLDVSEVVVQTLPDRRLTIRRSDLVGTSVADPFAPLVADDFESESKLWKLTGGAARTKEQRFSGTASLRVGEPGQAAEWTAAAPLPSGRLGIHYRVPEKTGGSRCLLIAEFGAEKAERQLAVLLAGPPPETGSDNAQVQHVNAAAAAGWHRLSIRFQPTYVVVGVDRLHVWSSGEKQSWGPLRKVTLTCLKGQTEPQGAVYFDDFALDRPIAAFHPRPAADDQDSLVLSSGDELFGSVVRATGSAVALEGRFGSVSFPWKEAAGIRFRAQTRPTHASSGPHVRVGFVAGGTSELDELDGTVVGLDENKLDLDHVVLGKVAIDRRRLSYVRWHFNGRRLELDRAVHHLGAARNKVPGIRPTAAEGPALKAAFQVETLPREATLVVDVSHLNGTEDSDEAALKRGGPRTEVLINGTPVDYLNHHLRRASSEVRRLRVSIPAQILRVGANVLELRQLPETGSGRVAHCVVSAMVLELAQ